MNTFFTKLFSSQPVHAALAAQKQTAQRNYSAAVAKASSDHARAVAAVTKAAHDELAQANDMYNLAKGRAAKLLAVGVLDGDHAVVAAKLAA